MNRMIVLLGWACGILACENEVTQDVTLTDLAAQREEIIALSKSKPCTDASNWAFTPMGSKACGGPQGYIAYSFDLDTAMFLEKVRAYTEAERLYNEQNAIFSDCAIENPPRSISCFEGVANLIY